MAITKEKKKQIGEKLSSIAKNAESIAFVNFHGLTMEDSTELRGALREAGVNYYVAKKSLIRRAFSGTKFEGELPELNGEVALAWSDDDALSPARETYKFAQKHEEGFSLVGGVYDGEFKDMAGIMVIAQIPPIDTLRGMFVNIINSPIQRFAIALDQIAQTKA